ncbi:MAG TPA: PAS domain S-box protein [Holophagaceae bacterium]|nr:PAS domain S-box protein [Holophagaceae bacterium]
MAHPEDIRAFAGSAVILGLLLVVGGLGYAQWRRTERATEERHRANQVIQSLGELLSHLKDAETGQRGFLISGDPAFLDPYLSGRQAAGEDARRLEGLLEERDPGSSAALKPLEVLAASKLDEMESTVRLAQGGGLDEARRLVALGRGRALMDQIRARQEGFVDAETRRRQALDREVEAGEGRTLALIFLLTGLAALALVLGTFTTNRQARARRLAQERLSVSEARFRLLIENAVDYAILMLDPVGRVESFNQGAERIKGYRSEEILGEPFSRFYLPEDVAAGRPQAMLETAAREGRVEEEGWRVRKDGSRFWANVVINAIHDEKGGLRGFSKVTRDLTERRRVEQELERSERRFRLLADRAPVGIYQFEPGSGAFFGNAELCAQAGLPPGSSREELRSRLHPEDASRVLAAFASSLETGAIFDEEYRYLHPEGREVWVHGQGSAVRDPEGHVASFIIISQDITRRRAAEERVRQSEERFRALAESASDAIVSTDDQGRIVYWNQAAGTIFGHSAEEALGQPVTLIIPREFREAHDAGMVRHLATGETHVIGRTVELQGLHRDGRALPVEISLSSWTQASRTFFTALIRDISARKATEAAVRDLNRDLVAANGELEAFAYSVSHDLRAPLRHIDGFVSLLKGRIGEASDPKVAHYLEVISGAAKQMGVLIDELLTFSRMGRAEVAAENFDLDVLVRGVVEELAPDCEGRNIAWHIKGLPRVHGDPALLRLALHNLLGNALKFTRKVELPRIEVTAQRRPGEWTLRISDNGAGFDMQYADKLFGVFQRLHRQDEFEGTGVGLANVARIVQKHGGRVSAEGAVGRGATFLITLPLPEGA